MARINSINQKMAYSLEKLASHGGEKMGNYVNAAGKFAIAPLMILYNPFSNETKENKKWAAIKHPIEALITLSLQLLALGQLYKGVDKLASKGKLNFNLVKNAKLYNQFPDKFSKELSKGVSEEKALKNLENECLGVFKDRLGTILTIALYVPILTISNKIYPVIAKKVVKNESK